MLPPGGYRGVLGPSNRRIGTLRVRDTCDGSQIPSQSRPTPASPRVRGQASAVERGIHLPAASGEKVARSCRSIARSAAAWARLHSGGERARSGGPGWTSGLGCAGWVWASTSGRSATTTIDADVLAELTADDLSGPRRRARSATGESYLPRSPRLRQRRLPPEIPPAADRTHAVARRPPSRSRGRRRRRTPATHRDVLRSRRFDGARVASRSRGSARDHRRLSTLRRRRRSPAPTASSPSTWATACWSISATPGARGRRRARRARRPRLVDAVGATPSAGAAAGPRRHRHRAGRRRRPIGSGDGAGARRSSARPRTSPPACRRSPNRHGRDRRTPGG